MASRRGSRPWLLKYSNVETRYDTLLPRGTPYLIGDAYGRQVAPGPRLIT